MSMKNYAVTGYGIILNGMLPGDELDELVDAGKIEVTSSFTGEAFPLKDDGTEEWGAGESFNDDSLYYLALPRYPRLFSAAYMDMRELVQSVSKAYRKVKELPKISDYRQRIRAFSGTYYG